MTEFSRDDVQLLKDDSGYNGFFKIRKFTLKHRLFKGGWSDEVSRELFVREPAVGVIIFDPKLDAVMLVEQFRIGAYAAGGQPWCTELVAGIVEAGESAQDVAQREAVEEAGAQIESLELISEYYSSPGGSSERLTLFCGLANLDGLGGIHGVAAEHEDIRASVVPFADAVAMLASGKICNAATIIAMQWLQLNHQRLLSTSTKAQPENTADD